MIIQPGDALVDWRSPAKHVESLVAERDGGVTGYLRYFKHKPEEPVAFLACDTQAAARSSAGIRGLPVDPRLQSTEKLFPGACRQQVKVHDATMLKPLGAGCGRVRAYIEDVKKGSSRPGAVVWPAEYDFC